MDNRNKNAFENVRLQSEKRRPLKYIHKRRHKNTNNFLNNVTNYNKNFKKISHLASFLRNPPIIAGKIVTLQHYET